MTVTEQALDTVDPVGSVDKRRWIPRWRLPAAWRRPLAIVGVLIVAFWVFVGYVVRIVLLDRRPRDTEPNPSSDRPPSSDLHGPFAER